MASGPVKYFAKVMNIDGQAEVTQKYKYKNEHGEFIDSIKIITDKDKVGTAIGKRVMDLIADESIDFPASAAVDIKIQDVSDQAVGFVTGSGIFAFTLDKAATPGMIRVYLNGQNVTTNVTLSGDGLLVAFDPEYDHFPFDGATILADYITVS